MTTARTLLSIALTCLALAPPGQAQEQELSLLTSDEMRQQLFGVHLYGRELGTGVEVDECIEPGGLTVYRVHDPGEEVPYSEQGRLRILETTQACFAYPPDSRDNVHCFRVYRYGAGYLFDAIGTDARFEIDRVVRGVRDCPEPGAFLS